MIYVLIYLIIGVVLLLTHYFLVSAYKISDKDKLDITAELWNDESLSSKNFDDDTIDKICNGVIQAVLNVTLWPMNIILGGFMIIRLYIMTHKK